MSLARVDELRTRIRAARVVLRTGAPPTTDQAQIQALQAQVSGLTAQVATDQSTITQLQNEVSADQTTINQLQSASSSQTISQLQTQVVQQQAQIQTLTTEYQAAENTISQDSAAISTLQSQLNSSAAMVSGYATEIATLNSQVASLNTQVTTLEQELSAAGGSSSALVAQLQSQISGLTSQVNSQAVMISGMYAEIHNTLEPLVGQQYTNDTQILTGAINTHVQNYDNLNGAITNAAASINTVSGAISSYVNSAQAAVSSLGSISTDITTLQNSVTELGNVLSNVQGYQGTVTAVQQADGGAIQTMISGIQTGLNKIQQIPGQVQNLYNFLVNSTNDDIGVMSDALNAFNGFNGNYQPFAQQMAQFYVWYKNITSTNPLNTWSQIQATFNVPPFPVVPDITNLSNIFGNEVGPRASVLAGNLQAPSITQYANFSVDTSDFQNALNSGNGRLSVIQSNIQFLANQLDTTDLNAAYTNIQNALSALRNLNIGSLPAAPNLSYLNTAYQILAGSLQNIQTYIAQLQSLRLTQLSTAGLQYETLQPSVGPIRRIIQNRMR